MLSRGEQQRLAIARALMRSPQLILADEPTASLDADNSARIADLLIETTRETEASILLVSHDDDLLERAGRVHRLEGGRHAARTAASSGACREPWPVVIADLRALRWVAWAAPLLVAIAVALGVAISAQETALRRSSAQAADDFDLLIGAPGSHTQLVLTTVYLQPEAIPLVDGAILNALAGDERVRAAAPIAFGDLVRGHPVVGTTAEFAARWGRAAPSEGRLFARENEAVVGADVGLRLGETVTPSHGVATRRPAGSDGEDEARHRHEGVRYTVVGRLPRFGTPWDNAILVPIETCGRRTGSATGTRRKTPGSVRHSTPPGFPAFPPSWSSRVPSPTPTACGHSTVRAAPRPSSRPRSWSGCTPRSATCATYWSWRRR